MTYNVFGGTLNPTLLLSLGQLFSQQPLDVNCGFMGVCIISPLLLFIRL